MPRLRTYDKLYIYTLRGETPNAPAHFGEALLAAWEDRGTTLLFFESSHEEKVREFTERLSVESLSETVVDYENWEAGKPVAAARAAGFLICPTWDMLEPDPGEIRIVLDPGVAFGTGLHPTTKNSLHAVRDVYRQAKPRSVLDLGCGTAILSMAALKLGAKQSVAVDYTSIATDAARRCLELNGLSSSVDLICGDVFDNLHHRAGLVLSNIYIQVIEKLFLSPDYSQREWIVISGIHGKKQHETAIGLIEEYGRELLETYMDENWYTYLTGLK